MNNHNYSLLDLVATHKSGKPVGIPSICTANPFILETCIGFAAQGNTPLCIEATCNQVNQYGGYTGMQPTQFVKLVQKIRRQQNLPPELMILGGDHLGPYPWKNESKSSAMEKAKKLVQDYVLSGFTKIHLDASMNLADDDKITPLPISITACRAAELCLVAENTRQQMRSKHNLCYVIGTEVPVPGGIQGNSEDNRVSSIETTEITIQETEQAFRNLGLANAWERVIAVVVHPGVEFDSYHVSNYSREKIQPLSEYIANYPHLIFEAHSTDYQTEATLRNMVEDHFVILKVGPELTFAYREAIFILAQIEREYCRINMKMKVSNIEQVIDNAMIEKPEYWNLYYPGNCHEQTFARRFSFNDRIRYYWSLTEVTEALNQLFANLHDAKIPLPLLSQYLPQYYQNLREDNLLFDPKGFIKTKINAVLLKYSMACR